TVLRLLPPHQPQQPPRQNSSAQITIWKIMSKRVHRGTDFRDFLKEEGMLEELDARALKQSISLQFEKLRKQKSLFKSHVSLTLTNVAKAARVLGRKVKL